MNDDLSLQLSNQPSLSQSNMISKLYSYIEGQTENQEALTSLYVARDGSKMCTRSNVKNVKQSKGPLKTEKGRMTVNYTYGHYRCH